MSEALTPYLAPTEFIESSAPEIQALAAQLAQSTLRATAIALFDWVRDEIRYDPYAALDPAESYRATAILRRGAGYCVHKAVLLAALGRAANIPSRLGFADVRNHKTPEKMRRWMGTDVFLFHGYTEFFLDSAWVKATPAFDPETSERAGALPVVLDGTHDAMLHPVDPFGHPHIEYLHNRGSFADVPVDEIQAAFQSFYPNLAKPGPT